MVFTSHDIRFGYWFQRKFAPPYEFAMRLLNDRFGGDRRSPLSGPEDGELPTGTDRER